jgi:UDP-N-acetylmuramoyl-tripeptide--D-alanyl-D-alanine ligase
MTEISIAQLHRLFLSSKGIATDTRKVQLGEMFFCLKGENYDANQFAEKALESGAIHVVIDNPDYYIDHRTILVSNTLESLQMLAAYHRRQFNIPVIGITGTNGKTTTKELMHAVLSKSFITHATQGNLNNHIGVPLTLLSMPKDSDIAIIEMGANHQGEIAQLCKIAEPNHALITSIGKAHLEGFGSLQGVINTKNELYQFIENEGGTVFVNADNALLMDLSNKLERITYGQSYTASVQAKPNDSNAFAALVWNQLNIQSQLVGSFNFDNIMAAIAVGNYFQVEPERIADAIEEYTPTNKRSQWLKTSNNELFLDAYNANPSSMEVALDSFEKIIAPNKWIILGDMLELGTESESEHSKLVNRLKNLAQQQILLVGPQFVKAAANQAIKAFSNTAQALVWLQQNPISKSVILLKGSRGIALEALIELL